MSYTLRGRLESRLAAALVPIVAAWVLVAALGRWWPVELAALMLVVGLALDVAAYHRLLPYQAGWLAVPMGLVELAILMGVVRLADVSAPPGAALGFFAGSWLLAQVLGHAAFPRLRLTYGEDGGELGRGGAVVLAGALGILAAAGGAAWATQPPTVRLTAGVHRGPIVITHAERLVGDPGAVVRGGIVVRASDVRISGVSVAGGDYGFDVDGARDVRLDDVAVSGAALDGIHVRRSSVTIRGCAVDTLGNAYGQGIDISYGFDLPASTVTGCRIVGGREGIVSHFANVMVEGNHVSRTELRGIAVTEMSMGMVEGNEVDRALGVGIYCGDHSECDVDGNTVMDTRPDLASGDRTRMGFGILAHYGATATVRDNAVVRSPGGIAGMLDGRIERRAS